MDKWRDIFFVYIPRTHNINIMLAQKLGESDMQQTVVVCRLSLRARCDYLLRSMFRFVEHMTPGTFLCQSKHIYLYAEMHF